MNGNTHFWNDWNESIAFTGLITSLFGFVVVMGRLGVVVTVVANVGHEDGRSVTIMIIKNI